MTFIDIDLCGRDESDETVGIVSNEMLTANDGEYPFSSSVFDGMSVDEDEEEEIEAQEPVVRTVLPLIFMSVISTILRVALIQSLVRLSK
jgi:hypothetical protein